MEPVEASEQTLELIEPGGEVEDQVVELTGEVDQPPAAERTVQRVFAGDGE